MPVKSTHHRRIFATKLNQTNLQPAYRATYSP